MAKITVLTAITGYKDSIKDNQNRESQDTDFVCFTDNQDLYSNLWKFKPACQIFRNPRRNAKIHKVLAHKYIDSEYSVWIDASLSLLIPADKLINEYLKEHDVAFIKHDTHQEPLLAIKKIKEVANPEIIDEQINTYRTGGWEYPYLAMGGVIIRRHTPECNTLFEKWWSEICRWGERDQISLPYIFGDKAKIINSRWQDIIEYNVHKISNHNV